MPNFKKAHGVAVLACAWEAKRQKWFVNSTKDYYISMSILAHRRLEVAKADGLLETNFDNSKK